MFSYGSEDRQNRALLKVSDSDWSRPQSFDAMGTTYEVSLPSSKRHSEINVGISIEEGEGKVRWSYILFIDPKLTFFSTK
jgi:vacuolar protein sorting-associated protein 13A/C